MIKGGDKVLLKPDIYFESPRNPLGVKGTVIYILVGGGSSIYRVLWSNGERNSYEEEDLTRVSFSKIKLEGVIL